MGMHKKRELVWPTSQVTRFPRVGQHVGGTKTIFNAKKENTLLIVVHRGFSDGLINMRDDMI